MTSAPNITAYDLRIEVRYSGEVTTACGWVEIDGERHELRVEADVSSRGATYYLDGKSHWWSTVEWLDRWFEDLWQEAAAGAGYDLDNEIDFDAHLMNEMEDHDA